MIGRDIAAVMITVDRSPGQNYLAETLANLVRGGLLTSERLSHLVVADSGPGCAFSAAALEPLAVAPVPPWRGNILTLPGARYCANENVARALHAGVHHGAPWVLFLEDDIDVCADFFDSVGAWLDDHARDDRRIYVFGANYPEVSEATARGETSWDYRVNKFYGTQALALRSEDALSLSTYLVEHCYDRAEDGTAYDLLMADWSQQRWPEIHHFLASAPSFVEHIGRKSLIRPRPETHRFPSWPGREWRYEGRRAA